MHMADTGCLYANLLNLDQGIKFRIIQILLLILMLPLVSNSTSTIIQVLKQNIHSLIM